MPKNPKRDALGSINVFYKPKTSKKIKGVPFDKIQNFSEKCRKVPKKTKRKNQTKKPNEKKLWSRIYFWKHEKCVNLERESNPRSPASQTPEN